MCVSIFFSLQEEIMHKSLKIMHQQDIFPISFDWLIVRIESRCVAYAKYLAEYISRLFTMKCLIFVSND